MTHKISEQDNFAYLTVALLALLLAMAVVEQLRIGFGSHLIQGATVLALAAGVWSIRGQSRWLYSGIGLVFAAVLATLASMLLQWGGLAVVRILVMLLYFLLTAWVALRQVLFSGPIDLNKIVGSVCIYLLLGLIWATLYALVVVLDPAAFDGFTQSPMLEGFPDLVYFSFVCLTTLGFGDISPAAPIARFLVYLEAVVGQFYIAIVVASLVGVRLSNRQESGLP